MVESNFGSGVPAICEARDFPLIHRYGAWALPLRKRESQARDTCATPVEATGKRAISKLRHAVGLRLRNVAPSGPCDPTHGHRELNC